MAPMMVEVYSGIDPLIRLEFVPPDQWNKLVDERRNYILFNFTRDCRKLVEWLQDAKQMWQPLGYISAEDLIANGYRLNLEEVQLATRWLEINSPKSEIGLPEVLNEVNKQTQAAIDAARETRPALETGRPVKVYEKDNCTPLPKGNSSARRIARLKRDHPEAVERLERGEFKSVAAAVRWAKGEDPNPPRKKTSDYEKTQQYYTRLDQLERTSFRAWQDEQDKT